MKNSWPLSRDSGAILYLIDAPAPFGQRAHLDTCSLQNLFVIFELAAILFGVCGVFLLENRRGFLRLSSLLRSMIRNGEGRTSAEA